MAAVLLQPQTWWLTLASQAAVVAVAAAAAAAAAVAAATAAGGRRDDACHAERDMLGHTGACHTHAQSSEVRWPQTHLGRGVCRTSSHARVHTHVGTHLPRPASLIAFWHVESDMAVCAS